MANALNWLERLRLQLGAKVNQQAAYKAKHAVFLATNAIKIVDECLCSAQDTVKSVLGDHFQDVQVTLIRTKGSWSPNEGEEYVVERAMRVESAIHLRSPVELKFATIVDGSGKLRIETNGHPIVTFDGGNAAKFKDSLQEAVLVVLMESLETGFASHLRFAR